MRVPTGRLWVVEDPEPSGPARADETPSPGRYIREQRLRRGLTQSEVAELTKIPRASIEALEDERFEALPGPVFVKGFLRCCARALEIDEQVVLDLLYEQERARLRADREVAPAPATAAAPARGRAAGAERADDAASAASPAPTASATSIVGPTTSPPAPPAASPPIAAPAVPGGLRPSPRSFTSGVRPRIGGGLAPNASGSAPITGGEAPTAGRISTPAILGRARDLLERAGAVASKVPGANFLLWIAVALLVLGVAFAVLMAIGSQRMLPPHS